MLSHVKERRAKLDNGKRQSFVDSMLDQKEVTQSLTLHQIMFLGGVLMEGGSDTSSSVILAFIQAMITFPDVQRKAQCEIDAVVGEDRSPLWSDYTKLPYIAMIVKETMRWRPVTPLSFPHASSEGM